MSVHEGDENGRGDAHDGREKRPQDADGERAHGLGLFVGEGREKDGRRIGRRDGPAGKLASSLSGAAVGLSPTGPRWFHVKQRVKRDPETRSAREPVRLRAQFKR
jgi:hypothetical protein